MERGQSAELVGLLTSIGAYQAGHFQIRSGVHTRGYIDGLQIMCRPTVVERCGFALATQLAAVVPEATLVVSAASIGTLLGSVGRHLSRLLNREVFTCFGEPAAISDERKLYRFRSEFRHLLNGRAIVLDDVTTTGATLNQLASCVTGEVIAFASIWDRGWSRLRAPHIRLIARKIAVYDPKNCPICRAGAPLVTP